MIILNKIFLRLEIMIYLALIETLFFLNISLKNSVQILKRIPVIKFYSNDDRIVSSINWVLYKRVLGLHFFIGNCMRYSCLLYLFLSKEYEDISLSIGVKKENGRIKAHCWLEKCNKPFYEPHTTRVNYKKMGEFRG